MSLPIWTPGALRSEAAAWRGKAWRLVEAQHHVSTLKLVDDLSEQRLLEQLIETTKPAIPQECAHLDYLLSTPFRYGAPYPRGSRFRRAGHTQGLFYCSKAVATAVAEMAFYRILFYSESPGLAWPNDAAEFTAFSTSIKSPACIDLTMPPFARQKDVWMHKADYSDCQKLAETAREAGVEIIAYRSVRDADGGVNMAVLACAAFAAPAPLERQTWRLLAGRWGVHALCEFPKLSMSLPREAFGGDPRLAGMDWERTC